MGDAWSLQVALIAAFLGPSGKMKGWANYWKDPVHIRQALIVGVGFLAFLVFMSVYGHYDSRRKERKRQLARTNDDLDYSESDAPRK